MAFGCGVGAIMLATSIPDMKANADRFAGVKQRFTEQSTQSAQLAADNQAAKLRADIASNRYKAGCLMVVSGADPTLYASIVDGMPVLDYATKAPIALNTVVCDQHGNTGVINRTATVTGFDGVVPVVGDIAFTGDRDVVNAAIVKWDAKPSAPQVQ